jgi:ATP-binding cassette, subfamily F, member 3
MLQLTQISKAFGGKDLFGQINWQIQYGDRVGLVGPNGCGKTTLLKIIAGIQPADEGKIQLSVGCQLGYLAQEQADADTTLMQHVLSGAKSAQALLTQIRDIETALENNPSEEEAQELAVRHGELFEHYSAIDGHTLEGRAEVILGGLGFARVAFQEPVAIFSGGWAMRAHLARLLLAEPDILLLDEPNNHLDLQSLAWLETFLADYQGAWVVVSHDRYFLNRTVQSIAELTPTGMFEVPGNYDSYVQARSDLDDLLAKAKTDHAKRTQDMERFVDRFRSKASKARQVQSRVKLLDKMQERHEEQTRKIAIFRPVQKAMHLQLPEPPRAGEVVYRLEKIAKAFGDKVVYRDVNLQILRDERIALVGQNGAGKSTLLKMLAGVLQPDSGTCALGHKAFPFYFAQHQLEMLNPKNTILQELQNEMPTVDETRVRGILGAFLFTGDAVKSPVGVLSGGEKSRLALAKMFVKKVNVLLLDEPTNHLDLESRQILETALANYPGAVVFISHDRYFINRVATKVMHIENGVLIEYAGDYDYYLWKHAEDVQGSSKTKSKASAKTKDTPQPKPQDNYNQRKAAQRETEKRAKALVRLEKQIEANEARMLEIDALLGDPDVFRDAERCKMLFAERTQLGTAIEALYAEWSGK